MAKKRKVGNLLALAVMSYLTMRPMHPYELSRTLRDNGDERSIKFTHGSVYMVVQQLATAGFVTERETSREGQRPERTVYELTVAGREEMRDWLRELVEEPVHEYPRFVAALSLISALPPKEAVQLLRNRQAKLDAQRVEIRTLTAGALEQGLHPLFLVEEDYRVALIEAESMFVHQLIQKIIHPKTGWEKEWAEFHDAAAKERGQS